MYEKPIEQSMPTMLPMGSGTDRPFRGSDLRLVVGGPANGETRQGASPDAPRLSVQTLAGPIDYLAEDGKTVAAVTTEYVASRVTFGGRVYRTWRLPSDRPEVHAVATVLAMIDTDPQKVKWCREID
jgi:hypothetical protein